MGGYPLQSLKTSSSLLELPFRLSNFLHFAKIVGLHRIYSSKLTFSKSAGKKGENDNQISSYLCL